ncbi:Nucleotidyltransferase domain-containing protein [Desulfofundulus australicus DSM 11792]|uniref:Nucleotidyltransferase domain-containing protein n=1 Tax=Desulfofundulus australicus DSM 11792 TaxID=1121425 RepID=A0A1M4ZSW8_9FIRM|nr:Nucleotidyltransferase domain-containing protein [Desulfofundulus australicus DSM 11792]
MQEVSWDLLRRKLDRYPLVNDLKLVIEAIIKNFSPVAVILFGSLARGDFLPDSDADLVVLLSRDRVPLMETLLELKRCDSTGMVEIFPYGWRQFIFMLEDLNVLALDAMSEGVALYIGDAVKWKEITSAVEKVFRKVIPVEGGWRIIPGR